MRNVILGKYVAVVEPRRMPIQVTIMVMIHNVGEFQQYTKEVIKIGCGKAAEEARLLVAGVCYFLLNLYGKGGHARR